MKPNLDTYFDNMPLIGMYLKAEYNNANTNEQLLNLMHKWYDEAERTTNQVRETTYFSCACYLYSHLSSKSYQSKLL